MLSPDDRRALTPSEFGHAVSQLLACCPYESQLSDWGARHAEALAAIRESHPEHHRAARDAYRARLRQLKEPS